MSVKKYINLQGLSDFLTNLRSTFSEQGHTHTLSEIDDYEVDASLSSDSENPVQNKVVKTALDGKAALSHTHDDRYYTESEVDAKLDDKADADHVHTVDSSLSSTSTNPVQNSVINAALNGKVPTTRTVNGKALSANITLSAADVGADASGSADDALTEAKSYTDTKVAALVDSAPETLDTLGELATAMEENDDAIAALESVAASKANASDLTSHTGNSTVHITSTERSNWNAAKTHADSAHAPSNAEVNQNAFSNVAVGSTTIAADTKTDTLTLAAGSNVTITPNAQTDTITIAATDTKYTHPLSAAGAKSSGLYKITTDANGHVTAATAVTKSDITDLGIPAQDTNTTYSNATTSSTGLMSASDKSKLDGIASGANNYTHPTTSGNKHIPAGGSSGQILRWSADGTAAWGNDNNTTYSAATTSAAGLMSAADKTKLNGIATGANAYTLPAATSSALGGVRTGYEENGKNYPVELDDDNKMYVNVPWTDTNTTYSLSSFGVTATAAELNKLDGVTATAAELNYVNGATSNIQTQLNGKAASSHSHSTASTSAAGFLRALNGSTSNFLRGDGTWATPPNTTYSTMTGASTSAAGSAGLVPAPSAGSATRYLRSDGTWAVPPDTNTTYTLSSFGITATAAELNKLDGVTATATELNYVDGVTSNIQTQLNAKAASSHNHSADNITSGTLPITRGGTGATSASAARTALGITPANIGAAASSHTHNYAASSSAGGSANQANSLKPVTTAGTGAAYTASVTGISSLTVGASFIMVPHTVSTTTAPTLNVNSLGAKTIRQKLSSGSGSTAAGSSASWLGSGKPVQVTYDGTYWVVDFTRPNAAALYGTVPVANGGTGVTTDAALGQKAYPVGSIYMTGDSSKNPASLFGGTWEKIDDTYLFLGITIYKRLS